VSINSIRKSVSLFWDESVTEDLLIEIKDRVDRYEIEVIKEVIREFKEYNSIRRFHHLPTLKRLLQPKIYKQTNDSEVGRLGESNRHTNLSKQTRKSL
jgi:hypothetical protein